MRIAAIDIGSNSTRLLIADLTDGRIKELYRSSQVTRLASGVEQTGELSSQAIDRLFAVLTEYNQQIAQDSCQLKVAAMTSAVRDASNGQELMELVNSRFNLGAEVISGKREAELTYNGATSEKPPGSTEVTLVIDIGGGSTEFIVGSGNKLLFEASLPIGVVRHTERYLHSDPPTSSELKELQADVHQSISTLISPELLERVTNCIAVAGTATTAAAIEQQLEPYDPDRVHGYQLSQDAVSSALSKVATATLKERKNVAGLHPDRAPTVVAGQAVLLQIMLSLNLKTVEVSEHDLLRGLLLQAAANQR